MVGAPPLPASAPQLPPKEVVVSTPTTPPEQGGVPAPVYGEVLNKLTSPQRHAMARWLASHPTSKADPIALAVAATTALTEVELLEFFDRLRGTMTRDLWLLLTEE